MPLTSKQKLKLVSFSKKKIQEENKKFEQMTAMVQEAVNANLRHGKDGSDGKDGLKGKDGVQGPQGPVGPQGQDGKDVDLGEVKSFVESLINARMDKSGKTPSIGGGGTPVKYITTITSSEYRINKNELQASTNIFGVNYAGDVTVYLPPIHEALKEKLIVINDESGSASSNNITIKTT